MDKKKNEGIEFLEMSEADKKRFEKEQQKWIAQQKKREEEEEKKIQKMIASLSKEKNPGKRAELAGLIAVLEMKKVELSDRLRIVANIIDGFMPKEMKGFNPFKK